MTDPRRIRIVIVDDHHMFRTGVRAELTSLAATPRAGSVDLEIAGEAGAVESAVQVIKEQQPDVVLLDVHLPGGDGHGGADVIRACNGIQTAAGTPVRFLALSVSDAAEDVIAVIRAGARGYVTKTISGEELADAIRRVHEGDAVFSPRLAGFVLDAFAGAPPVAPHADAEADLEQLTPREREVLQHIARGYMYKEIARRLEISTKTVEAHVAAVLRKLQLSSRHELSRWAMERRLVE